MPIAMGFKNLGKFKRPRLKRQPRPAELKSRSLAPFRIEIPPTNGKREVARRVRQNAHQQQRLSHQDRIVDMSVVIEGAKPWDMTVCSHIAVKPTHIFGFPALYDTCCTCCAEPWRSAKFRQADGQMVEACINCHSIRELPGPKEGARLSIGDGAGNFTPIDEIGSLGQL